MRHLSSIYKRLLNRVTLVFSHGRADDSIPIPDKLAADSANADAERTARRASGPVGMTKRGSTRWWGGVAEWGIQGNEEFTQWWNHWMSRIPHSGARLSPNRARKNDV
jgi:hypothetical protein